MDAIFNCATFLVRVLVGAKEVVPKDEYAGEVFVMMANVFTVMDSVVGRGVENIAKAFWKIHILTVNKNLIDQNENIAKIGNLRIHSN